MKEQLIQIYKNTPINIQPSIIKNNTIKCSFVEGAKVEITGSVPAIYTVEFTNRETGIKEYRTTLQTNNWCKTNKEYLVNWDIKVYQDVELVFEHSFDLTNKRVLVYLDSIAIGDTIAWFSNVERFKKEKNCQVIVCTYHNYLFEKEYPELEFSIPGAVVSNLYAQYNIGFYYNLDKINYNKVPINFKTRPLQDTTSAILGLKPLEIKPKITIPDGVPSVKGKYVVIAPHASAHAKYWNNPGGWQIVIDYLVSIGYQVVMITQEKLGDPLHDAKLYGTLQNVVDKTGDISLKERIIDIKNADFFIGVGSGLSWLSWGIGTKTILISGFSNPDTEFQDCVRINTPDLFICTGCFNRDKLDAGDWDWCPEHRNTERIFECTKTILPETVIENIKRIIR